MSGTAKSMVRGQLEQITDGPAKLSHALYRMSRSEQWALITSDLLSNILSESLPRPNEQLDNLILWLGENQPTMGESIQIGNQAIAAIGTTDIGSVGFLTAQAIEDGLISGEVIRTLGGNCLIPSAQLTLKGWKQFDELQRGKSLSRKAFMAMQFGDLELDLIYQNHFKQAVSMCGFNLKRLDEGQPAGLIDDRLRVEIRQCRFLIADITHQNRGAYWEAGFAEGLGKPVIYTCRKDVFEDKTGTHFDTNHHLTVVWESHKLIESTEKLKATIRATLPEESKLSD